MSASEALRRRAPDHRRLSHPLVRETLAQADIVCMQEVWLTDAIALFEGLGHEHKVRDSNRWTWLPLTVGGSGLGLASRLPVVSQHLLQFQTSAIGSDRLARKGMIAARLRLPQEPVREIDIITTHMQAMYGDAPRAVRARQLGELRQLVDDLGAPERAFVLCGDLNIDGLAGSRAGEYTILRELFGDFVDLGAPADQPTVCPDPELNALAYRYGAGEPTQRVDYVLFRPAAGDWLVPESFERVLDGALPTRNGTATFPSDHFGVRARLHLNGVDAVAAVAPALFGARAAPSRQG